MTDQQFLLWIYNRLINVHNENYMIDYMRKFRNIIENIPKKKCTPNIIKSGKHLIV